MTVHTYQLTFTALNTTHEWTVNSKSTTLKRVFADSTDENFEGTDTTWFAAVQTPAA